MNILITIGLCWVIVQLIGNRILITNYLLQKGERVVLPAIVLGFLLEAAVVVYVIIKINS